MPLARVFDGRRQHIGRRLVEVDPEGGHTAVVDGLADRETAEANHTADPVVRMDQRAGPGHVLERFLERVSLGDVVIAEDVALALHVGQGLGMVWARVGNTSGDHVTVANRPDLLFTTPNLTPPVVRRSSNVIFTSPSQRSVTARIAKPLKNVFSPLK